MNKKHDWDEVKHYFVTGDKKTLKAVASVFNIPYQSVRRVAAKERWVGCRLVYREFGVYCYTAEAQKKELSAGVRRWEEERFKNLAADDW